VDAASVRAAVVRVDTAGPISFRRLEQAVEEALFERILGQADIAPHATLQSSGKAAGDVGK
jgi:hypothetical protein